MAEFGMGTWSATGAPELNAASFTMRVVYSAVLSPSTWGGAKYIDISIAGITPQNAAAFPTPVGPVNAATSAQLEPEVMNGSVRVWRTIRGDPYGNSAGTGVQQRLVVVRFK